MGGTGEIKLGMVSAGNLTRIVAATGISSVRTNQQAVRAKSSTGLLNGGLTSRRWASVFLGVCAFNLYCTGSSSAEEGCMDLKTTASGLQYCDIVVGTGKEPVKGAKIEAHYIGKLTNGQKF